MRKNIGKSIAAILILAAIAALFIRNRGPEEEGKYAPIILEKPPFIN